MQGKSNTPLQKQKRRELKQKFPEKTKKNKATRSKLGPYIPRNVRMDREVHLCRGDLESNDDPTEAGAALVNLAPAAVGQYQVQAIHHQLSGITQWPAMVSQPAAVAGTSVGMHASTHAQYQIQAIEQQLSDMALCSATVNNPVGVLPSILAASPHLQPIQQQLQPGSDMTTLYSSPGSRN